MGKLSFPRETCELPHSTPGLKNIGLHGVSLVIQSLGLHTSNAGGAGSIPGQGARNPTSSVVQTKRQGPMRKLAGLRGCREQVSSTKELPDLRPERREITRLRGGTPAWGLPWGDSAQATGLLRALVSTVKRALAGCWESKPELGAWSLLALDLGKGPQGGRPGPNYLSAPIWPLWGQGPAPSPGRWMGSAGQPRPGAKPQDRA